MRPWLRPPRPRGRRRETPRACAPRDRPRAPARAAAGSRARRERGRDRDRRAGIAPRRLEHDVGLDAELAQLLGHDEAEIRIGDDDRPREQRDRDTRASVCWKVERSPISGTNCFGMLSRDTGHSRVPAPPHINTGTIRLDMKGIPPGTFRVQAIFLQ